MSELTPSGMSMIMIPAMMNPSAPKEYGMPSALEHHKELHYNDDSVNDTQAPPLFNSIG